MLLTEEITAAYVSRLKTTRDPSDHTIRAHRCADCRCQPVGRSDEPTRDAGVARC